MFSEEDMNGNSEHKIASSFGHTRDGPPATAQVRITFLEVRRRLRDRRKRRHVDREDAQALSKAGANRSYPSDNPRAHAGWTSRHHGAMAVQTALSSIATSFA